MNRKDTINFVNTYVLPGAEIANWEWLSYGKEIVGDIIKAISTWRMGKPINVEMNCRIIDGVLYINGDAVKRVASKLPRPVFSEEAYCTEGRILARQESDYA